MKIDGLEVLGGETHAEGGFLTIRRMHLRNRREDGSLSESYICDFATRPKKGVDAVAVAVFRRDGGTPEVLLRRGLRPALSLGRQGGHVPMPDPAPLMLWELVAGIIEPGDVGEEGIRGRAVSEVWEEAGYRVAAGDITTLGAAFYASPGSLCELVYAAAVEVPPDAEQQPLSGDGSPMEEGASTRWVGIDDAIAECRSGSIQDAKSELLLCRLRDRLAVSG